MQIENGNIVHLDEIARIYQPQTISSTELTEEGFLVTTQHPYRKLLVNKA